MGPIHKHEQQNNKYQKPFAMQNAYLVTSTYDISGIRNQITSKSIKGMIEGQSHYMMKYNSNQPQQTKDRA
jgi:hypothetical protein